MKSEHSISFEYRDAVYLQAADLWLDPHQPCPFAFVSHAHADHFAPHQRILCSQGTYQLIKARFGERESDFTVLEFGESREENGLKFTVIPAGHIAGSAQLFVEDLSTGDTLIYTGDFKTRQSLMSEPIEIRQADILIMETTFGLPKFVFPPTNVTLSQLAAFVQLTLDEGDIPIVEGYSLGKAQELIAAIHARLPEIMFQVHPSVQNMNLIFREMGFTLPECEIFDPSERSPAGFVVVVPPTVNRSTAVRSVKNARSAVATGWAVNSSAKYRYQVDEAFPLSDHAGYDELLAFVEEVNPHVVYTLHGYASEFATDLRSRGREAWSLSGQNQLELDLGILNQPFNPGDHSEGSISHAEGELAELTRICDQIREVGGKNQKKEILAGFLSQLSKKNLELVCLYLSGRCFPAASPDGKRRKTGAGWAVIKRALIRAAEVSESEFREVSASQADGARTTFLLLEGKGGSQPASIIEVAGFFESLAELSSPMAKEGLLVDWFQQQHHAESALIVSILLGDLRIGLGEGLIEESIADAFDSPSTEVRKAQMYTGHLGLTAILAMEGRLDQWELTPFNPLSSMLASPAQTVAEIEERLGGENRVWLEDKFDGIRAQLHKFDDWAEWFSRDLRSLTGEFPELVEAAMSIPDDVVLDGEIIAYAEGRKLTFFDLQTRLGRKRNEGDLFFGEAVPVTFVVFDLLWKNGRILTETPLQTRREMLEELNLPSTFQLAEVYQGSNLGEIETIFKAACDRGNEGVIAKDPLSQYLPGRRGKSWLKLKRDAATIDVIVVKAQQGHGKRAHVLSDYTFSVREEATGLLKVIGKAYSGLTDEEIEELTDHFRATTVSVNGRVHTVEPSVVLEIAFDSIQSSKKHDSGLSLRFPRIKAIRRDKTIDDIDTLESARKMARVTD